MYVQTTSKQSSNDNVIDSTNVIECNAHISFLFGFPYYILCILSYIFIVGLLSTTNLNLLKYDKYVNIKYLLNSILIYNFNFHSINNTESTQAQFCI